MMNRLVIPIFMLAAFAVAIAVFRTGLASLPASTDESIIALQARHMVNPPDDPTVRESVHPRPLLGRFPLLFMAQPYLFPIEAYIAAVPSLFLPDNTLGARAVPFALGLGTLWLSFLILRNLGGFRDTWPGLLLLVFPSAYVAELQFGYALPSYPSHLFCLAAAAWLMQRYAAKPGIGFAMLCGIACGAACAGNLMAAPLPLMCGVLILLAGPGWNRLLHAACFGVPAAAGWIPYLLAKRLYPGAYDAVSGTIPWSDAQARIWEPALTHVLTVASGIQCAVFPDNERYVELLPALTKVWPWLWLVLLVSCIVLLAAQVIRRKFNLRNDPASIAAIFIGFSIAGVLLFALSRRSHSHTYRYLLPVAWCLPFLFAYAISHAPRVWIKRVFAIAAVGLALFNAATLARVMKEWRAPGFAANEALLYDTGPALKYLEEQGIDRVYASYHLAYRLTYLSGGRVVAAQYYNERFYGWPYPFRSAVDASDRPAYVLAPKFAVNTDRFVEDAQAMGLTFTRHDAGELTIFHGFDVPARAEGAFIIPDGLAVAASDQSADTSVLIDGDYGSRWRSRRAQADDMWIELTWREPIELAEIYLYYNYYYHDRARALDFEVRREGAWQSVAASVARDMNAHEFDLGRPLYGNQFQRVAISPIVVDGLRVRVSDPEPGRDWTVGEVRLWGRAQAAGK